jgi:hypothetical protein
MVLLLHKRDVAKVAERVRELGFDAIEGDIAPGAQLVDVEVARAEIGSS